MCKVQNALMEQLCDGMQSPKQPPHVNTPIRAEPQLHSCSSSLGFHGHKFLGLSHSLSPRRWERAGQPPVCRKINHLSCWTGLTFSAKCQKSLKSYLALPVCALTFVIYNTSSTAARILSAVSDEGLSCSDSRVF